MPAQFVPGFRIFACRVRRHVSLAAAISVGAGAVAAAVSFDRDFAPQKGLTAPVEQPWRQEICLNGTWQFQPVSLPDDYDLANGAPQLPAPTPDGWSTTPIKIPSPWNVNRSRWGMGGTFPSYPKDWESVKMGWLRRDFTVPEAWSGKRVLLHFEAVTGYAQVVVNGKEVVEHFDNSLPFTVDVTNFVRTGSKNTLLVGVRAPSLFDVPGEYGKLTYPSGSVWNMTTVGISQDVFLQAVPPVRVENVFVKPLVDQGVLELEVTVRNNLPTEQTVRLGGSVRPWINHAGADTLSAPEPNGSLADAVLDLERIEGTVVARGNATFTLRQPISGELKFWTPETPNLYGLILDVEQGNETVDRSYERFGWRQWGIKGRDATLNGKPIQFLADSSHLLGVQHMTRRYAWAWYHALKSVNGNAIRLHAMVRPRFYLDLADEMGIAILDESDIWASTTDINYSPPETWQRFAAHIDGMVHRDRNHASVFGWSIANEIFAALSWKGVPREYWPRIVDGMVDLARRVPVLDPTRPWISSDGDGDYHGRLPVYIYHYGEPADWIRAAPKDRPMGHGEAHSMIWGSPVVFSTYNGERSYESLDGMMEGAAIEAYEYLVAQRKLSAFCSLFTFEGLAFTRLPMGMKDPDRMPTAEDGIFFGPFVEGKPGMQPERLPPYNSTFNPGYDPDLPLFETTQIYESFKAAYAPGGPQPCQWDHRVESPLLPDAPAATVSEIAFVGNAQGDLKKALAICGVPTSPNTTDKAKLLVIDGATLSKSQADAVRQQMSDVLARKGTVFVWVSPENLEAANSVLPEPVSTIPAATQPTIPAWSTTDNSGASALLADRAAPETASISLASLYFADQADPIIVRAGLAGPLVDQGKVLMRASNIRRRGRTVSGEQQAPTLVRVSTGGGKLLVTTLTSDVRSGRRMDLMRNLFTNLGVKLEAPNAALDSGFDGKGYVREALLIGGFSGEHFPAVLETDFLGDEARADPKPGDRVGDLQWVRRANSGDGIFDIFRMGLPHTGKDSGRLLGTVLRPEALDYNPYLVPDEQLLLSLPGVNMAAYASFWIYSPQAVSSTPAAGGDPTVAMHFRADDGKKIWLNHELICHDTRIRGPGLEDYDDVPISLRAGWNHFLVKIGQLDALWLLSARFEASSPELMAELRASPVRPE